MIPNTRADELPEGRVKMVYCGDTIVVVTDCDREYAAQPRQSRGVQCHDLTTWRRDIADLTAVEYVGVGEGK